MRVADYAALSGVVPRRSKVWDGSTWAEATPRVWVSGAWTAAVMKVWDGSNWIGP